MAAATIVTGIVLIVPTAHWVHLRLPKLRPAVELITLMPFVIPAVVLVFGLIRSTAARRCCSYPARRCWWRAYGAVPSHMYRAVDTGLRVSTCARSPRRRFRGWPTILWRVILPNLRVAVLSGAFLDAGDRRGRVYAGGATGLACIAPMAPRPKPRLRAGGPGDYEFRPDLGRWASSLIGPAARSGTERHDAVESESQPGSSTLHLAPLTSTQQRRT